MVFEEIPFSEIEARLLVEVGTWKNFDEIEEYLILDELLLLVDCLNFKKKEQFRMMAAVQGINVDDDMDTDEELPEEILAADRELHRRREEAGVQPSKFDNLGINLGYEVISEIDL